MTTQNKKRIKAIADLLFESAREIEILRRQNQLLSAKVEVIEIFGRATSGITRTQGFSPCVAAQAREAADALIKDFVL